MIDLSKVEMKGNFVPDSDTLNRIRKVTREQLIDEITPDRFSSDELVSVLAKFELNRFYNVLSTALYEWLEVHGSDCAHFNDEVRKYKKLALADQIFSDM